MNLHTLFSTWTLIEVHFVYNFTRTHQLSVVHCTCKTQALNKTFLRYTTTNLILFDFPSALNILRRKSE